MIAVFGYHGVELIELNLIDTKYLHE